MVFYDRQGAWFGGTRSSWRCGPEPSVFDRRPSARAWAVTDLPGGRLTQLPPVRGSEGPARMAGRASTSTAAVVGGGVDLRVAGRQGECGCAVTRAVKRQTK